MGWGGNKMTTKLLEIIKEDIKRCEEAQSSNSNKGTEKLYQALIAKYNGCHLLRFLCQR